MKLEVRKANGTSDCQGYIKITDNIQAGYKIYWIGNDELINLEIGRVKSVVTLEELENVLLKLLE